MSHGGGGEGGDKNRWLVSYADFITLLMVLFVIMWAMGKTDIEKYRKLAEAFKAAFGGGGGGPTSVIDTQINQGSGGSTADGVPDPITVPGIPKRAPESVDVTNQLSSLLKSFNLGGEVNVKTSIEGNLISMGEKLLFTPGTLELNSSAYPVLDQTIEMLKTKDNEIRIVGHTDDTPSSDSRYPTNWELSIERAWIVADYMINAGIGPERLIVAGRGETDPLFPNTTAENRALNSRVEIVVLYGADSEYISGDSPLSISTSVP